MMLAGLLAGAALPAVAEVMDSSPRPVARGGKALAAAGQATRKPVDAEALIQAARLGGSVAFVVMDGASGAVLQSREPDLPLPPASVAKAVTALYALDRLGPTHRFVTRVLATGPVQGGMVQGDIVLAGGGDPTLQTDQLGDLVARLAQSGLKGATGRFLYWDGALPGLRGIAEDQPDHVGYNAAISGLCLNFNRVHFEWKREGSDWRVAVDARGERFLPPVGRVRVAIAQREAPLFTYAPGQVEEWTVAAGALGKGGSRWLPVRDPGAYVAEVFRTLARAQGIRLEPGERVAALPAGSELGRLESEPLTVVLRDMLRFSTNLTAECVGLAASRLTTLKASARAMSDWVAATFGVQVDLHDHSGLGGRSRVTARAMATLLQKAEAGRRGLKPILRDMGMKDDKGEAIKGSKVKVLAKSGTLNFVSGLAGHVVPPAPGRELVFAIFTGDPGRRDAVPVALREEPEGGKAWTARARRLQGQLINRWAGAYA
ncbi:D-alanyl-D-alanine carboxypeptidase/D-alanyl-D-alanine-endopeptidase [Rhodobacter sp. M37P]|uniref:D-alanyl-D-alanine carboxypeptidase/D-alanyl-D-alanine-endopeptidase n=2 Tax=Rhodobacter calidifons TaxID=2715277 RepID=A0ABX0G335_9RHOB|nr:D-alanyl-D-alanine carboxypeptidase/D-alanyl-D-alanine-endopeptidase [Rhodobacter calidifons]NHB75367.1 D-alanyl-D-alanine carboxypeptidase/D-alanyl-D-alanine-endopeptidase [Rhodobacter calidifons]